MAQNLDIVMARLQCGTTTELGHDEVYYMLGGATYDKDGTAIGDAVAVKGPGPGQGDADNGTAWDMNDDHGSLSDRNLNAVLWTGTLEAKQSAKFVLIFMESDTTKTAQDIAKATAAVGHVALSAYAGKVGDIIGAGLEALAGFVPVNEDDKLGSASFKIEANDAGEVYVTSLGVWTERTAILSQSADHQAPYWVKLHLHGDGSSYISTIQIHGAGKAGGQVLEPWG